jgi:hypothetical protein
LSSRRLDSWGPGLVALSGVSASTARTQDQRRRSGYRDETHPRGALFRIHSKLLDLSPPTHTATRHSGEGTQNCRFVTRLLFTW